MKALVTLLAAATLTLGLSASESAAATPGGTTIDAPQKVVGEGKKAPAEARPSPGDAKTIPMNSRADAIDLKGRFFITKRKDKVEVKNVVTASTEIKQGQVVAKFEDIKAGDYVSGSRRKVSETEYTVVKITKFGPREPSETKSTEAKAN